MPLPQKVLSVKPKPKPVPVWAGPGADGPNGGVTYSMLAAFLQCRVRFAARYVDGWKPAAGFVPRMEFGNLWHAAEEHPADWRAAVKEYAAGLGKKYPLQRDQVAHWEGLVYAKYPAYLDWRKTLVEPRVTPVLRETVFDVPYKLPDGTQVRLRGKADGVDAQGGRRWLVEHKTKSSLDQTKVSRQLSFDLQTMLYLTVLPGVIGGPLAGVRYNVVKRSAHRQGRNEEWAAFLRRVEGIVRSEPDEWFARWTVHVSSADVDRFRRDCLDPLLKQVCCWYAARTGAVGALLPVWAQHWRHPFGVTNWVDELGYSDLDAYLDAGSIVGLTRSTTLFEELA